MVYLKSSEEISKIRSAGKILQEIFERIGKALKPGITTMQLNSIAEEIISARNAKASFLNYGEPPFPASICASINEEVVHGIPSEKRILKDGDIISIDAGAYLDGFHADAARTYAVGDVGKDILKLIEVTRECFFKGFEEIREGNRISDVSAAVEKHAVSHGYGVVRQLTGHGIGRNLHEDPDVPNFLLHERGPRIREGLVIAVEPMINMGSEKVYMLDDGWTIVTADYKPSAHYENTVAVTANGPQLMTEDM
ncbi:MAG: type I methionyl aminopeptidase [Eubacteriales bacterium]|jgi:methionyl aminopeptidase|nr:type I methionyl aminopeptidase [Eubacteriales bacterium]MDD4326670.1 type I methionyl aminopeptidase [Eubacteriales bacterium]MDD4716988.1 type I methionyl aminopeptidase [Eubacteriales bacterium]NCU25429.1 type I methionyl aminopeptidase [Candidatus Nomurabacteria bacterium]